MTNTKNEKELVLEIGAEGGSLEIYRDSNSYTGGYNYYFKVSEMDFTDEGLGGTRIDSSDNFYTVFDMMDKNYPWHQLHPSFVHDDFKEDVADFFVEKLNLKNNHLGISQHSIEEFEKVLNVKLRYNNWKLDVDYQRIWIEEITKTEEYKYDYQDSNYDKKLLEMKITKLKYNFVDESNFPELNGEFLGTVKVKYNSLLIFDTKGILNYILPANKYAVTLGTVVSRTKSWKWFPK